MKTVLTIFIYTLFLPLVLLRDVVRSRRQIGRKLWYGAVVLVLFGVQWLVFYSSLVVFAENLLYDAGISDTLTQIPVSGTSMLPTIKDGEMIALHNPKKFGLARADKVSFDNTETGGQSYLKRIVGLPGETISIQNGTVIINGQSLSEPYTLNKLPTYGNTFLLDCEEKTIPSEHYFVMGDNRTVSSDSRVIGFVKERDIDGVIKADEDIPNFATPENTYERLKVSLDSDKLLNKLNTKRETARDLPVITHDQLGKIANERAAQIADNIDRWKQEILPLDTILSKEGYKYNLIHEFVTFGYLDESAVLEQILDSRTQSDKFLSREITEVGIGIATLQNGACSVPVIVAIASWPSVPTYDQVVIDQWQANIDSLDELLKNMQTWVDQTEVDQEIVRDIISGAAEAHLIATRIHTKLVGREWIDANDHRDIEKYQAQVDRINVMLEQEFSLVFW